MIVIVQKNSKPTENQCPSFNLTIHKFIWAILSFQATFGPVWVKAEGRDSSTDAAKRAGRKKSHLGWAVVFGYMTNTMLWKPAGFPANPQESTAACQDLHQGTFLCLKLLAFLWLLPVWLLSSGMRLEAWDI